MSHANYTLVKLLISQSAESSQVCQCPSGPRTPPEQNSPGHTWLRRLLSERPHPYCHDRRTNNAPLTMDGLFRTEQSGNTESMSPSSLVHHHHHHHHSLIRCPPSLVQGKTRPNQNKNKARKIARSRLGGESRRNLIPPCHAQFPVSHPVNTVYNGLY